MQRYPSSKEYVRPHALLLVLRLLDTNPSMKQTGLAFLEKLQATPDLALGFHPTRTLKFDTDEQQQKTWRTITRNMPFRFIRLVAFMFTLDKLVMYAAAGDLEVYDPVLALWGSVMNKAHADAIHRLHDD